MVANFQVHTSDGLPIPALITISETDCILTIRTKTPIVIKLEPLHKILKEYLEEHTPEEKNFHCDILLDRIEVGDSVYLINMKTFSIEKYSQTYELNGDMWELVDYFDLDVSEKPAEWDDRFSYQQDAGYFIIQDKIDNCKYKVMYMADETVRYEMI